MASSPGAAQGLKDKMTQELIPTVLETLFFLFKTIYRMAENVKCNKERCRELTQRVKSVEKLVLKIQQKGPGQISGSLGDTLRDLCYTFQCTEGWMMNYTKTKRFKSFIRSGSHEQQFKKLNENLSESIQFLSLALLVEHGEKIDTIHDTLTQRGLDATRQRAPIPSFTSPEPTPASQALVPSLPQLGPSNFSRGVNFAPFGQTSAFNPVILQSVPQTNIGFSNAIYSSPCVSQFSNFPNMAPMNSIPQYSSVTYSNNGTVTCVSNRLIYLYK